MPVSSLSIHSILCVSWLKFSKRFVQSSVLRSVCAVFFEFVVCRSHRSSPTARFFWSEILLYFRYFTIFGCCSHAVIRFWSFISLFPGRSDLKRNSKKRSRIIRFSKKLSYLSLDHGWLFWQCQLGVCMPGRRPHEEEYYRLPRRWIDLCHRLVDRHRCRCYLHRSESEEFLLSKSEVFVISPCLQTK